jgi:GTPase
MFVDEVTITVKAGDGGNGAATFRTSEGKARGGPDGGNGGNGGNVYFRGVTDMSALQPFQFKKVLKADDGVAGKRKNLFGRNADDLIIPLPLGTIITVPESNERYEIAGTEGKILIVRGGKGGKGNNEFKSATNQAPTYAERGEPGEEKIVHLELKLIADVGLIGLPNAGKSSLLSVLTNATPKIGNYPFTTLEPNLGVLDHIVLADIPGLIEGASQGKGLGVKFLKHVERTRLLVHCIDASSDDVLRDYETVRKEFAEYNKTLLSKPEIIVLTKSDTVTEDTMKKKGEQMKNIAKEVISVSLYDEASLELLRKKITAAL